MVHAAGGLAVVGVVLELQRQTARVTGMWLNPSGALSEEASTSTCVHYGQHVQVCPHDTLKPATLTSGLVAGTLHLVARSTPCKTYKGIPCTKVYPSGALDREVEFIGDSHIGLAVLLDHESCLNY